MSQLHLLYHLQQIDAEIRDKKGRLREVLHLQKENEALRAAELEKASAGETLKTARREQTALDLELNRVVAKAKRSEERLYSGKVRNPKELSDLQQEIEALGRRRRELEDALLEAMLVVEDATAEDETATANLQRLEADWSARRAALEAEQNELAVSLNELIEARELHAARIAPSALAHYEETLRRRGGVAVAVLKDGLCQACGVRVSANKARAAQAGEIAECGSCDRILYIP